MSDENHRRYTAGFLFRPKRPHVYQVLLVRKTHPKWQAGMMNAVGGEMEVGETGKQCMEREFREEAGFVTSDWDLFCTEQGPGYDVHFYRYYMHPDMVYTAPKQNDKGEELEWCDPNNVKYPVIGNLHWLLKLAQDPRPLSSVIRTSGDIRKIVTW